MLTWGEIITRALGIYQNPGSEQIGLDQDLRAKADFFGIRIAKRAHTLAPYWWKLASGTVSLVSGVGSMPTDFGTMGESGNVWVQGQPVPVGYEQPDVLDALLQTNNSTGTPECWTLSGKTAAGLSQIKTYPRYTGSLDVRSYEKRCPDLIDFPIAPAAADSGGAGLLNGVYTWRVTNVHAAGETEGGTITSPSLSLSNHSASLTGIPVSLSRAVTSRKVYRTVAGGIQHKLAGTIADNLTTTFTDNVADGSLGVNVPTAASGAVSGVEVFPEDFLEELFVVGIATLFTRPQGDMRESGYMVELDRTIKAMWANQKQGRNEPQGMPRFGQGRGYYRRPRILA